MTLDGIIFMESSGVIREAFRAKGLNVYSCDFQPADDGSPHHFQGDARQVIREHRAGFFGFHPTCTYVCGSGIHWNDRGRGWEKTDAALGFILWCMSHTETPYYLENPRGIISTMIRRPDQEIQPYQFGDDASKLTCLWLNKLPCLRIDPAKRRAAGWCSTRARWLNAGPIKRTADRTGSRPAKRAGKNAPAVIQASRRRWLKHGATPPNWPFRHERHEKTMDSTGRKISLALFSCDGPLLEGRVPETDARSGVSLP